MNLPDREYFSNYIEEAWAEYMPLIEEIANSLLLESRQFDTGEFTKWLFLPSPSNTACVEDHIIWKVSNLPGYRYQTLAHKSTVQKGILYCVKIGAIARMNTYPLGYTILREIVSKVSKPTKVYNEIDRTLQ